MITIVDSENDITEENINSFQSKFNLYLPLNYKEFLMKFNGGYTDDSDEI